MLLAKSADKDGRSESLLDHSLRVVGVARGLIERLPDQVRSIPGLAQDLEAAAAIHDIGKSAVGFQAMLDGEKKNWNGWRHETLSAAFASELGLTEELILAVLTHHRQIPGSSLDGGGGRLCWFGDGPEDWEQIKADWKPSEQQARALWQVLCQTLRREDLEVKPDSTLTAIKLDPAWLDRKLLRRQIKFISIQRRRHASLLRGLLISADHLASAGQDSIPPVVDLKQFKAPFALRDFQKRCAVEGDVILRAPTGSGKTEAALVWAAANQVDNGRFFYTLPYTSALNSMHDRLKEAFPGHHSSIGLLHGRAAHHLYSEMERDFPNDKAKATHEAMARARLAREMYHPFRVCTPHQLLRFTLRGKGWEQMLSEIPGSCIVFDEIHSYDPALAGLTLGTAKLFQSMGARSMFVSATLPSFMEKLIQSLIPGFVISPDPDSASDRSVLEGKRHTVEVSAQSALDLVSAISKLAVSGVPVLVVCNHVRSAQQVAQALRPLLGGENVCLFHGRFNMRDRRRKESLLGSRSLPLVLVATQVVEVSLDISYGAGFFEAAPLDALAQRMGRVNRKGEAPPAPITITKPISKHRLYDSARTDLTKRLLSGLSGSLSERDLVSLCDRVYEGGYTAEEWDDFKRKLDFILKFDDSLVAGEHNAWIERVIGEAGGRADVLPRSLRGEHQSFIADKRWLDADSLLVNNVFVSSFRDRIDTSTDPWVINVPYTEDGLES